MRSTPLFETDAELEVYKWESVHIEELSLADEFARCPSDMAYWGERLAEAYRAAKEAKADIEAVKARRGRELRDDLQFDLDSDPKKSGKPTVAQVDEAVRSDAAVRHAISREIDASYERERLQALVDSIKCKKEMLISLGATQRADQEMTRG